MDSLPHTTTTNTSTDNISKTSQFTLTSPQMNHHVMRLPSGNSDMSATPKQQRDTPRKATSSTHFNVPASGHYSGLSPSQNHSDLVTPRLERKSGAIPYSSTKALDRIKEFNTTTGSGDEDDDEDEDDPEMILISQNGLSQSDSQFKTPAHNLRRTPGASQSYRPAFVNHTTPVSALKKVNDHTLSRIEQKHQRDETLNPHNLRRTPGASMMHKSAAPLHGLFAQYGGDYSTSTKHVNNTVRHADLSSKRIDENELKSKDGQDASSKRHFPPATDGIGVMGYGLTLSTPVGGGRRDGSINEVGKDMHGKEKKAIPKGYTSIDVDNQNVANASFQLKNPAKLSGRDEYLYTPAGMSLAKNSNLNLPTGSGSFSPNTIQLATNLDTLLDDDEVKEERKVENESLTSSPEKAHSTQDRDTAFPSLNPVASFGTDSHISVLSNGLANDDWYENFTLDTSLLDTTLDKSLDNDDGTYHRPKPVSLTAFQRSPSDVSSGSVSDISPNKEKQQPINFNARPIGGGAFSPPSKHKQQHTQNEMYQPRQRSFDPTASKSNEDCVSHNYHYQYMEQAPVNEFDRNMDQNHPVVLHPQYSMQHPYNRTNAHTFNSGVYHDSAGPSFDSYHQNQDSSATNHNMSHPNYGHQPHAPHMAISPANAPVAVSPLTVPPYPMHHPQYPARANLSPAPFNSQQLGSMAWTGIHPHQRDQAGTHWVGSEDRVVWEQHQSHVVPPDYTFDGNIYSRREFGHPPISTPTPPPLYSWPSSDHDGSSIGNIPHDPGSLEAAYHIPPIQNAHDLQTGNAHALYHFNNGEAPKHRTIAKENNPASCREEDNAMKKNKALKDDPSSSKAHLNEKEKLSRNKQTKKSSKKHGQPTLKMEIVQPKKKLPNDAHSSRRGKEAMNLQSTDSKPTKVKKDNRKVSNDSKAKKKTPKEEAADDMKRAELVESPATRAAFKEFYRKFRVQEKISLQHAADFALDCLSDKSFPSNMQWRIYLELADLSKRENRFNGARKLYSRVCTLQPYASQGWLEYSKLEEECGNLERCSMILSEGLLFCQFSENLLTRAIKHEERIAHERRNGDLSEARQLLAPLKHSSIDKVWRTVLEGAMMEARAGNGVISRRVLKYLMHWVPWYGPLYLEAFRLERDSDRPAEALAIVERGLKEIPRYGPLWFGAFRLCEGLDLSRNDLALPKTMDMIKRSIHQISKELLWKVHLEAAQALERAAHLQNNDVTLNERLNLSRKSFVQAVHCCPENLCWKVWLAAGRMELSAGRFEAARNLFMKSFSAVPEKGRPAVFLECARLEEFVGDLKLARAILTKSRTEAGSDWKVWLQSVSLEIRNSNHERAVELAQEGLTAHPGTGRLWAALVQLRDKNGEDMQMNALKRALSSVPKSGEVWCEAARLFLNPLSSSFDLDIAAKHLDFATKFTPQYGDSFLETVRLQLLQKWIVPITEHYIDKMKETTSRISAQTSLHQEINKCMKEAMSTLLSVKYPERQSSLTDCEKKFVSRFKSSSGLEIDISELELRCCNADPNYGKLWFHCRIRPADTARTVLRRAKLLLSKDISDHAYIYVTAVLRRFAIQMIEERFTSNLEKTGGSTKSVNICVPTINSLFSEENDKQDIQLLERGIHRSRCDFVTGLVDINQVKDVQSLSLIERRKILFGSDLTLSWKQQ